MWGWQFRYQNSQEDYSRGRRLKESWRGDGMMGVSRMSRKRKGKMVNSRDTPVNVYGLETLALTEKQQEKVQVCKNDYIRRIVGVNRADKRRTEELRVQVGAKESLRINWQGVGCNRPDMRKKWEHDKTKGLSNLIIV